MLAAVAAVAAVVGLLASGPGTSRRRPSLAGARSGPARTASAAQSPRGHARPRHLWSATRILPGACALRGAPLLAFPSDSPTHRTGPGGLAWGNGHGCPAGEGTMLAALAEPALSPNRGSPAGGAPPGESLPRPLALVGAPHGELILAAAAGPEGARALEGGAGEAPRAAGGVAPLAAPVILAGSYLGDVGLLARPAAGPLQVQVERHFRRSFGPAAPIGAPPTSRPLALALDYRSDAIAVWAAAGAIYARYLPASGASNPVQRVAPAPGRVHLAALLSDDGRAILAWSTEQAGSTSVYYELTAQHVRVVRPTLIERFDDPREGAAPVASPILIRLRSESVMLAWAAARSGRWAVRTAAIDLLGAGRPSTVSEPGAGARLAGLTPAPDGGALVWWTRSAAAPAGGGEAIEAAWGVDEHPDATRFGPPERVGQAPAGEAPAIAFDPSSDRAIAAWRTASGALAFAVAASRRPAEEGPGGRRPTG